MPEMASYKITQLIRSLNSAIDAGQLDDLPLEELRRQIADGNLRDILGGTRLAGSIDTSVYTEEDWEILSAEWQGFAADVDHGRKLGVDQKALCLLLGYAIISLEQRIFK